MSDGAYYPKTRAEIPSLFERRSLEVNFERLRPVPLMVSRANALPDSYFPGADQILWTAGSETWRSLAKRNYWVSGSFDALGESVSASIEFLAPEQAGQFVKLSHDGPEALSTLSTVATYTLLTKNDVFLPHHTPRWFFWMSGSAFLWALAQNPEIVRSLHSCGAGNTLKTLIAHVPQSQLRVYPNFEIWQKQISRFAEGRIHS